MKLAEHPVSQSAAQRGVIDGGARYLPTRKTFVWSETRFTASPLCARLLERHTMDYRIFWHGPANDRDHLPW